MKSMLLPTEMDPAVNSYPLSSFFRGKGCRILTPPSVVWHTGDPAETPALPHRYLHQPGAVGGMSASSKRLPRLRLPQFNRCCVALLRARSAAAAIDVLLQ